MDSMIGSGSNDERVWSDDLEKVFQQALVIYPNVGRKKQNLINEGIFGRNELIARYIFQKTGLVRSRKQVSSHIQVIGKRRFTMNTEWSKYGGPWRLGGLTTSKFRLYKLVVFAPNVNHFMVHMYNYGTTDTSFANHFVRLSQIKDKIPTSLYNQFNSSTGSSFFLVKLWADVSFVSSAYNVNGIFESCLAFTPVCRVSIYSAGKPLVDKTDTLEISLRNGFYEYAYKRDRLCDFTIKFLNKLNEIQDISLKAKIAEHVTIVQNIWDANSLENLICIIYMFEPLPAYSECTHAVFNIKY